MRGTRAGARVVVGLAAVLSLGACSSMPFMDRLPVVVTVTPPPPSSAGPTSPSSAAAPDGVPVGTPTSEGLATPFVSGARDWTEVAKQVSPAVVRIDVAGCDTRVVGTGFFIASDLIVTAGHVASGASAISVQYAGGVTPALVVGIDRTTDTALLRTDEPVAPATLKLATAGPGVGAAVGILGYPNGTFNLHATEAGVFGPGSVDYGSTKVEKALRTDASITDGVTGGPVVDPYGALVGLVTGSPLWVSGVDLTIAEKKAKSAALKTAAGGSSGDQSGATDRGARVTSTGFVVPVDQVAAGVNRWREGPNRDLLSCYGDQTPVIDDPFALKVEVASGHAFARDVAGALALHGQAINTGAYEVAYEIFTPRLQQQVEGLYAWRTAQAGAHWDRIEIRSMIGSGNVVEAKVALRTTQDKARGVDGQTCSIWEQSYTMRTSGGGWLIDRVRDLAPPSAC